MHLFPHIIVRPRYVMVHPIFVKSTSHPALHSVTTLMRECDAKPGMMWARCAADGRPGRSNIPVCVERTLSSLGRRATIGFWVGWMLVTCAPVVRKLLVVPEFKMAHLLMVSLSMLTVRRSVAAARAYGWVGVGRVDNIFCEIFILLLSAAPPCQKFVWSVNGRGRLLVSVVTGGHCVLHHCSTTLGRGHIVGSLVGRGMGSKTPTAGSHGQTRAVVAKRM